MSQLFTSPGLIRPAGFLTFKEILTNLGLTTNLELALDAADLSSYASGQKWLDTSGNGYDFFRGADGTATTDDPTFNGTAGNRTANEYWSFDGGDFFSYDTTNETWMDALHRDNADFTLLLWMIAGTANDGQGFGTASSAGDEGIRWRITPTTQNFIAFRAGAATAANVTSNSGFGAAVDSTWHMIALSVDEASGASGSIFYLDGSADTAFDGTYTSPNPVAAQKMHIGAEGDGAGSYFENGSQLAIAAAFSESLTEAQLDSVWEATRGRFGV